MLRHGYGQQSAREADIAGACIGVVGGGIPRRWSICYNPARLIKESCVEVVVPGRAPRGGLQTDLENIRLRAIVGKVDDPASCSRVAPGHRRALGNQRYLVNHALVGRIAKWEQL